MKAKDEDRNLRLFESRLDQIINLKHELCVPAGEIDWSVFESEFGPCYSEGRGRPAKPIRRLVGLHYLKHAFNESDESVVERFLENPYWQHFCGFEYFQRELPPDPTTQVTQSIPGAKPPHFEFEIVDDKTILMKYKSSRKMLDFAAGLVKGVGRRFNENLKVVKVGDSALRVTFP